MKVISTVKTLVARTLSLFNFEKKTMSDNDDAVKSQSGKHFQKEPKKDVMFVSNITSAAAAPWRCEVISGGRSIQILYTEI